MDENDKDVLTLSAVIVAVIASSVVRIGFVIIGLAVDQNLDVTKHY